MCLVYQSGYCPFSVICDCYFELLVPRQYRPKLYIPSEFSELQINTLHLYIRRGKESVLWCHKRWPWRMKEVVEDDELLACVITMEQHIKCSPEYPTLFRIRCVDVQDTTVNTHWWCPLVITPPHGKANNQQMGVCWACEWRGLMNGLRNYWKCKWKSMKRHTCCFSIPPSPSTHHHHLPA